MRDKEHLAALNTAGWECLVLWECELEKPSLADDLKAFLEGMDSDV